MGEEYILKRVTPLAICTKISFLLKFHKIWARNLVLVVVEAASMRQFERQFVFLRQSKKNNVYSFKLHFSLRKVRFSMMSILRIHLRDAIPVTLYINKYVPPATDIRSKYCMRLYILLCLRSVFETRNIFHRIET